MYTSLRIGDRGEGVKLLQAALTYLGYKPGAVDGVFGPKVEAAVEKFQRDHKLYADGVVGRITASHINQLVPADYWVLLLTVTPIPNPVSDLLTWVKCSTDKVPNRSGYTSTWLREDVALAFNEMYTTAHDLGGVVTSAGGRRALSSKAGANRSRTSMHYVGRAHDLAVPTGMVNPDTDQYICVRVEDTRKWTVWCRSSLPANILAGKCKVLGIRGGEMTLEGTYVQAKKVLRKTVTCVAFDFTALAGKFGFVGISARLAFFNKGDIGAAEWWHIQHTKGLTPNRSTFGDELRKVYSLEDCQKFVYWDEVQDNLWGQDWF